MWLVTAAPALPEAPSWATWPCSRPALTQLSSGPDIRHLPEALVHVTGVSSTSPVGCHRAGVLWPSEDTEGSALPRPALPEACETGAARPPVCGHPGPAGASA